MKPLSKNTVKAEENPDELSFVVEHESGWVALLFVITILTGVGLIAWKQSSWWLAALCGAGLVWIVFNWLKNPSRRNLAKLEVNEHELLVILNLIEAPNRILRFKPYEVKSLEYRVGGEHEPSGLYLNNTCVFDGLDRKQCEAMVTRIFYRFPEVGGKDDTPTSMLHGDDSGITSLGISCAEDAGTRNR